jgi:hypothetical protein
LEDLLHWNLEDVRDAEGDFDRRRVALLSGVEGTRRISAARRDERKH